MKPNSPFQVTLRVAGYSALVSLAIAAYMFVTSRTPAQYLLTSVATVLMLLLSVTIGFYVGLRHYYARLATRATEHDSVVHYPARSAFEQKMSAVDANLARSYKKDGRYA